MLAVGVDIIEVARVERALARHGERFSRRIFTEQERAYCRGRMTSLAGRFAIKEAVGKALGTGLGAVGWRDIEVINDEQGKPHLLLHGRAKTLAAELGLTRWAISLSHTETQAIGFVVATGE